MVGFSLIVRYTVIFYIFHTCCVSECESVRGGGFITTQIGPKPLWNETYLDRLKKDLLMNYDKYARPEHFDNATKVKLSITILHLETEESKSTVSVHSWFHMEWSDSKLKWNNNDYGGISSMRIGDHEVWQPDMYLYNSASGGEQIARFGSRISVVVQSIGVVIWVTPVKLTALCEYNLRYWPFDTQHCFLKMAPWVHSDAEIDLKLSNEESSVYLDSTISGSSWAIDTHAEMVTKKYPCCEETYSSALFNLTITRKSSPYYAIVVTPAVVTTFLILMPFFLPPYAGEKIIVNGFTLVVLNMFLLYFNHQVSAAGCHIPLIVIFFSSSLYIVSFSMVSAIVSFSLCRIRKRQALPVTIKGLLQGKLGNWLFLGYSFNEMCTTTENENIEEMKDPQVSELEIVNQQASEALIQSEWITLLVAVDRILFVVYCFIFIVLAFAFL